MLLLQNRDIILITFFIIVTGLQQNGIRTLRENDREKKKGGRNSLGDTVHIKQRGKNTYLIYMRAPSSQAAAAKET